MESKHKSSYLIKHQQETQKSSYQINIIKTESKQENDTLSKFINSNSNDIFSKFINSQTSTYSKISNQKKNPRERQFIYEKPKDIKETINKSQNKCKSSSLNKDFTKKYNKNIIKNNNLVEDCEPQSKFFNFVNVNNKENPYNKRVNKCASAHKTSYSIAQNFTGKKLNNKRFTNSPSSFGDNTTMALTSGNLLISDNSPIINRNRKDSSFIEANKEKINQKNLMELSSAEELHFFQVNVIKSKNKLAYKFENCLEEHLENYDEEEDHNDIVSTVVRTEDDNFFQL
jgi:hypothetical protein